MDKPDNLLVFDFKKIILSAKSIEFFYNPLFFVSLDDTVDTGCKVVVGS